MGNSFLYLLFFSMPPYRQGKEMQMFHLHVSEKFIYCLLLREALKGHGVSGYVLNIYILAAQEYCPRKQYSEKNKTLFKIEYFCKLQPRFLRYRFF